MVEGFSMLDIGGLVVLERSKQAKSLVSSMHSSNAIKQEYYHRTAYHATPEGAEADLRARLGSVDPRAEQQVRPWHLWSKPAPLQCIPNSKVPTFHFSCRRMCSWLLRHGLMPCFLLQGLQNWVDNPTPHQEASTRQAGNILFFGCYIKESGAIYRSSEHIIG